uniref:Major facilitator superfamily (MFS) profile domain-containing protein n=1 Tax=Acrobeloides nanus TaxID=290746 RepID=A0A914DT09_9BILA
MLLTTVIPIIPEYLLRISNPNASEILLDDKIPDTQTNIHGKRQVGGWDNMDWNNTGDTPGLPNSEGLAPKLPPSPPRSKPKSKTPSKSSMRPTNRPINQDSEEIERNAQKIREVNEKYRHDALTEENVHVGLMFGSKALVQLITNPLIGQLTNKIGYTVPMFTGFVIMFLSTLMFAFGGTLGTLWLARALQGIGSACTSTSGMGMLAQAYPDDAERGSAMGIALGGLALGVLVGPPYGGLIYEWAGKELPFILLALLALFDGVLQCMILKPKVDRGEQQEGTAIKELLKDPYILVAAGSITIGNLGIAMLEPSLPLWMMESWKAGSFERGAAFLPASISYLIGTTIFGPLAHKIGSGFIGLAVIGFCLLSIPSAESVYGLIVPLFCMGFSIGMIDASMFPQMGYIVDVRHVGVYGSIYAIADAAFCFAFALGPFFSGPFVRTLGFPTMMYIIALINFLYAPLMFFLRKLPERVPRKETSQIMESAIDGNPQNDQKIERIIESNPRY